MVNLAQIPGFAAEDLDQRLEQGAADAFTIANEAFKVKHGRDIRLRSAFRDPERNRRVGGAPRSKHVHGLAIDIDKAEIALASPFLRDAGFNNTISKFKNTRTGKVQDERNHFEFFGFDPPDTVTAGTFPRACHVRRRMSRARLR